MLYQIMSIMHAKLRKKYFTSVLIIKYINGMTKNGNATSKLNG